MVDGLDHLVMHDIKLKTDEIRIKSRSYASTSRDVGVHNQLEPLILISQVRIMNKTEQTVLMFLVITIILIMSHTTQASTRPELDKTPVYLQAKYPKEIESKTFIEKMGPIPMWECIEILVRYHRYYQRTLSYPPELSCKHIQKVRL